MVEGATQQEQDDQNNLPPQPEMVEEGPAAASKLLTVPNPLQLSNVVFAKSSDAHYNANFGHLEAATPTDDTNLDDKNDDGDAQEAAEQTEVIQQETQPIQELPEEEVPVLSKDNSNVIEGDSDMFSGLGRLGDSNRQADDDQPIAESLEQNQPTGVTISPNAAQPQVAVDAADEEQKTQVDQQSEEQPNQDDALHLSQDGGLAADEMSFTNPSDATTTTTHTTVTTGTEIQHVRLGSVSTEANEQRISEVPSNVASNSAEASPDANGVNRGTVGYYAKEQFRMQSTLGRGAFGLVYLASRNGKQFALKQLEKAHITKYDKVQAVFRERDISSELTDHNNVVKFHGSFQDDDNLYFLLEYCPYGSLADLLKHFRTLPTELTRFYAAQIVSTLEFMHSKRISHRDLKPQNILIDDRYCLKITDFGDSKKIDPDEDPFTRLDEPEPDFEDRNSLFGDMEPDREARESNAFVGTALYISPEMLDGNISSPAMDLWALGCMVYEMRVGQTPFHGTVDFEVFKKINERQLTIPNDLEPEVVDFIDKLLQLDPRNRLGMGQTGIEMDYAAIKAHPFFSGINFDTLETTSPPIPADRFKKFFEELKARSERTGSEDNDIFTNQSEPSNQNNEPTISNDNVNQIDEPGPATQVHPKNQNNSGARKSVNLCRSSRDCGLMTIYQGVVMKHPKRSRAFARPRCRNMVLTNQPRLYFTSTEAVDGKEGMYLSDIMLYNDLKVATNKSKDILTISCPISQFTYQLRTNDASVWHQHIQKAILEKVFEESSMF